MLRASIPPGGKDQNPAHESVTSNTVGLIFIGEIEMWRYDLFLCISGGGFLREFISRASSEWRPDF